MEMFFNFGFITLTFLIFCDARVQKMSQLIADFQAQKHRDVTGLEPVTHPIQLQCNISRLDTTDIVVSQMIKS